MTAAGATRPPLPPLSRWWPDGQIPLLEEKPGRGCPWVLQWALALHWANHDPLGGREPPVPPSFPAAQAGRPGRSAAPDPPHPPRACCRRPGSSLRPGQRHPKVGETWGGGVPGTPHKLAQPVTASTVLVQPCEAVVSRLRAAFGSGLGCGLVVQGGEGT